MTVPTTVRPVLELTSVDKRFDHGGGSTTACDQVSFAVAPGEIVGLVGESGSGKSTVANLVLGLLRPDGGEIRVDGRPLASWLAKESRALRCRVQAVFQQPLMALDSRRSVGWSVAEPLVIHGIGDRRSRKAKVAELLESVGLDPGTSGRLPHQMSGGQLQRVNIARALVLDPDLLVCDEAVSALDVSVQAQVLDLFLDVQERRGLAMLFISHDLAVVRHLCDRLVVMRQGVVVEAGPTDEVCDRPAHAYTQQLMAASLDLGTSHAPVPPVAASSTRSPPERQR
jgi:ABC-type glutathione transport system ATPase component